MTAARILAATALLMAVMPVAAPAENDITLDGLNLGEFWYGAEVSKKDLLGKVVLVEIYGS